MTLLLVSLIRPNSGYGFHIPTRHHIQVSRRNILASVTLFAPLPALAKETIPITRENVKKAFDDLRYELSGKDGGVARTQNKIDEGDWAGLIEITKTYDQELRKGKVGLCKSSLPKREQAVVTVSANAITFDLIGINRNARPGQEDANEANRYLDELRTDLKLVIDEEKYVMYDS